MLRTIVRGGAEAPECSAPEAIWFDLESPVAAEEADVEATLGVDVPIAAEREAFEDSARFYEENDALYLTATLLGRRDEGHFISGAVTFILARGKLVTVRYIRPRAFEVGAGRASARLGTAQNGADVFYALLEGAAERLADLLAESTASANAVAAEVFDGQSPDLRANLKRLGRAGAVAALAHDSLSSLQRLLAYAHVVAAKHELDGVRVRALQRDVSELERVAENVQNRVAYLQDAALGLINATQADVLKALSLATMAFVPPTLIASIFGMNFRGMTWFDAPWGAWAAGALMLAAPAALFAIARWRRWF
jgi:magnesium transporter